MFPRSPNAIGKEIVLAVDVRQSGNNAEIPSPNHPSDNPVNHP
jgi:hypothetical protein